MSRAKMAVEISKQLENDYLTARPTVANWLRSMNGQTPKLYTRALMTFEANTETNVEQLLEQADNGTKSAKQLRDLILQATTGLTNPMEVRIDSAVRGLFTKANGFPIAPTGIHYKHTQHYDEYTKEETHQIIDMLDDLMQKACAIVAAESGLRPSTILQLQFKHIEKDLNREGSIALRLEDKFHYGRKKSGFTFIGKRSRDIIKRLIELEKINTDPEAKLFDFTLGSIERIVKTAKKNAEIKTTANPMYGFRKFFLNGLNKANTPSRITDMLFGRFKDIDANNYTSHKVEELREYYDRAYAHLDYMDSNPEQSIQLGSQLTRLQDQNSQLSERLRITEEKLSKKIELQTRPHEELVSKIALLPDERILDYLGEAFLQIALTIRRARQAENMEPPDFLKLLQITNQDQSRNTTTKNEN